MMWVSLHILWYKRQTHLHSRVVCIFVRNKVCCFCSTAIRIESLGVEELVIDAHIFIINSAIKCESDHHRQVANLQLSSFNSRSCGAISRAEAVRQETLSRVAHIGLYSGY